MEELFYCYSLKLKDFLKLQGVRFITKGLHKNGNTYWVFVRNSELCLALDKWNEYKKFFGKER